MRLYFQAGATPRAAFVPAVTSTRKMNLNFGGTATTTANATAAATAATAAPFRFTAATPKVRALLFSSVVDSVVDPVPVSGSGLDPDSMGSLDPYPDPGVQT